MITVSIAGPSIEENAGFLDHTLLVTLTMTNRSDLWVPVNIYAVLTESLHFHTEQVKRWAVKNKMRVLICKLELSNREKQRFGLYVPAEDVWPFSSFQGVNYLACYDAAALACEKSQSTEASVITLWSK